MIWNTCNKKKIKYKTLRKKNTYNVMIRQMNSLSLSKKSNGSLIFRGLYIQLIMRKIIFD